MSSFERTRRFSRPETKGKHKLVNARIKVADECQNAGARQLCVAKQITDDACGKQSSIGIIPRQEFDRAEPVIFILPVWFNLILPVYTKTADLYTIQNSSLKLVIRRLPRCLDPALMSAAPHYGLRYGCAPVTGNFQ